MKTSLVLALLISVLLSVAACTGGSGGNNGEDSGSTSKPSAGRTTSLFEGTRPTGGETTKSSISLEETTGQSVQETKVVLRLEGDPRTRFSGLCRDGETETVLNGKVPKRFDYDLGSGTLSCRIQKRDSGDGNLKVTLVADDATRSVQQTNTEGATITISYQEKG